VTRLRRILRRAPAAFAAVAVFGAAPFGLTPCSGIRPGAPIVTDGDICTLNFLFKGSDGGTYVGTAGHCYGESEEIRTWSKGTGPEATVPAGQSDVDHITGSHTTIGRWVFKALGGHAWTDDAVDFGLIRVDRGIETEPAMCHFGGPSSMQKGASTDPVTLHYYGNGRGFRDSVRARTAVAPAGYPDPYHVWVEGPASPGDSGAGVVDDAGAAVGLITAIGVLWDGGTTNPETDGDMGVLEIFRLRPQLRVAERELGIKLRLVTAK
jgi:hypothetical protein